MRKLTYFLVLLIALALAACGQLTPPEITSQPDSSAATQPAVANTEPTKEQPTEGQAASTAAATPAGPPACRVDTSAQAEAAQADLFPKVGPEWSKGSPSAYLTITEYSDFQ